MAKETDQAKQPQAATETEAKNAAKTEQKAARNAKKSSKIVCAIIGAILLIVAVICGIFLLNRKDPSDPTNAVAYSKSFFIYDDGGYSLWNADGKRLTDDIYSDHSAMLGNYALVEKDGEYGIISANGKMSVAFGKYDNIESSGGLYLATNSEGRDYLLKGDGRVIASDDEIYVDTYGSSSSFTTATYKDNLYVYNYAGKEMLKIAADFAEEPKLDSTNDYSLVYYAGKNYVFDNRAGKKVAEFEAERFMIDSVSENRTMVLLTDYDAKENYKVIANGKLHDLEGVENYALSVHDVLVGYNDSYGSLAILDNDFNVAFTANFSLALKDYKNYAVENDNDEVEIYQNGEKVATIGDDAEVQSTVLYDEFYAIRQGDKYGLYRLDGTLAYGEYEDVWEGYDEHHHAVVADETDKYYLIDNRGHKINDETYYRIYDYRGGYTVYNDEGGRAILSVDGRRLTDFKYTDVYYRRSIAGRNIWTGKIGDELYDVIDLEKEKVIATDKNLDGLYNNYFTAKNTDNKIEYYTYNGDLFYTSKDDA